MTAGRRIWVANAPVSYGVFEMTAGSRGLPAATEVLDDVRWTGHEGIDLGPPGYLGQGEELARALARRGLGLAGGWIQLPLSDDARLEQGLEEMRASLAALRAAVAVHAPNGRPPPRPTLADAGSPERQERPGAAAGDVTGLGRRGWRTFARNLAAVAQECRAAGLEPTFHHHAGTYVESVAEIDTFLEVSDVGLCLDNGHLLLGGGDPLEALDRWRDRINHVHVKDVDCGRVRDLLHQGAGMRELWEAGVFCELGTGDARAEDFVAELLDCGYRGWLVVEQDRILAPGQTHAEAGAAQRHNRSFLARVGI